MKFILAFLLLASTSFAQPTFTHLGTVRPPHWGNAVPGGWKIYRTVYQAMCPVDGEPDTFFITWDRNVGKVKLPTVYGTGDIRLSPNAVWLKTPVRVGEEWANLVQASGVDRAWADLNGVAQIGNKVYLNYAQYYHVQPTQYPANLNSIDISLDGTTESPLIVVTNYPNSKACGGFLSTAPPSWTDDEKVLIRGSFWENGYDGGPTFYKTDLTTYAGKFGARYSLATKVDETWSDFDSWNSLFFMEYKGVQYWCVVAKKGTAPGWYGTPGVPDAPAGVYDSCNLAKGRHAFPYLAQIWMFKGEDIKAVFRGEVPAYSPKPVYKITLPEFGNCGNVCGACVVGDKLFAIHEKAGKATTANWEVELINYFRIYKITKE
jgi:hypothetical protein